MARVSGSVGFEGMRGAVGNAVLIPTADGMLMRERIVPHNPRSPGQTLARNRQSKAMRAWTLLSDVEDGRWRDYAAGLAAPSPRTGLTVAPRADNVFTSLYSRMLLIDPNAAAPGSPPVSAFFGDVITPAAAGTATGLTFSVTANNSSGRYTQLLVQRLANARRKVYPEKYVHAAVVTFTTSVRSVAVPLSPGWYACAFRFIKANSGQATDLAPMGVFRVG